MHTAGAEPVRRGTSSDDTNDACSKDDPRKRNPEGKNGDERGGGDGPEERVAQRPRTNSSRNTTIAVTAADTVQDAGDGRDVAERER